MNCLLLDSHDLAEQRPMKLKRLQVRYLVAGYVYSLMQLVELL